MQEDPKPSMFSVSTYFLCNSPLKLKEIYTNIMLNTAYKKSLNYHKNKGYIWIRSAKNKNNYAERRTVVVLLFKRQYGVLVRVQSEWHDVRMFARINWMFYHCCLAACNRIYGRTKYCTFRECKIHPRSTQSI